MGTGLLFIGFFFLFDFQIALKTAGSETVYAILDIFPDAIGWLLIFIGTLRARRHEIKFKPLVPASAVLFAVSVFTVLSETAFFGVFYPDGNPVLALRVAEVAIHLGELAFSFFLFRAVRALCKGKKEEKLVRASLNELIQIAAHGVLFVIYMALSFALPKSTVTSVIYYLEYLFWIAVVWYGAVTLIRCDLNLSAKA